MKTATSILVICVGALLSLGMVMLYSADLAKSGSHFLMLQSIWAGIGLVACVTAALFDYRHLKKVAWPIYALLVIALVLVLIPGIGTLHNGARRWFNLKIMMVQPSEFAKLGLILILAYYGDKYHRVMSHWWKGLGISALLVAVPLGLIFVEPDRGTTLLLMTVCGSMMLIAGVRVFYLAVPAVLVLLAIGYTLQNDTMRQNRITSWLNVEETKRGVGWQAYQAKLAIGAGGVTGLGLANGRQKLGFIPEHHTDFIFAVVGEELGLVATLGVLAGFIMIVAAGAYIATHARDLFGFLLASGITMLIGWQAFINMGVVTGVLPNKGLSLPFLSYGGSSLVLMLTCVGLLLSVALRAESRARREETNENVLAMEPA